VTETLTIDRHRQVHHNKPRVPNTTPLWYSSNISESAQASYLAGASPRMDDCNAAALAVFQKAVATNPLVQCITNFVSMDIMANTLLAAGCSPAMAHCLDEVTAK
jgi:hypothetical protein